jgi:hypothetical protein
MIQIAYEKISSPAFVMAMQKLTGAQFDVKTAYSVKKLADALQSAKNKVHQEYEKEVLQKYADKDEAGKLKQPIHLPDEVKDAFLAAQEEFGKRTLTIDRGRLTMDQLGRIQLSAQDLSALEELISENGLDEPAQVVSLKG